MNQKKLKVLKTAVKQERVEKEEIKKELEVAMKNIESLKLAISDKVKVDLYDWFRSLGIFSCTKRTSICRRHC